MKINLINFLLLPVAILLAAVCFPLGILFTGIQCIRERSPDKGLRYLSHTSGSLAIAIDQLGNVVCKDLFNALFITAGGYGFGVVGETVSSALGKNKALGTLTKTGRLLADLLNILDPNHVERAAGLPFKPDFRLLRITMKLKLIAQTVWRIMPFVGIVALVSLVFAVRSCSDVQGERDVYRQAAISYRDTMLVERNRRLDLEKQNAESELETERNLRYDQAKSDAVNRDVNGMSLDEQAAAIRANRKK